jgi:hypothetical protein
VPNAENETVDELALTDNCEDAFNVTPKLNEIESLPGTNIRNARKFAFATATPDTFAAMVNNAPFASRLAILIEEITAELPAGTPYSLVNVFAAGFCCPKIV